MNSGLYLNKQQVAFIIHPKQTNQHSNINKRHRRVINNQKQSISLQHSYMRKSFSSKVLFSFKQLNSSSKINETNETANPHLLSKHTTLSLSHSQLVFFPQQYSLPGFPQAKLCSKKLFVTSPLKKISLTSKISLCFFFFSG